MRFDEPIRHHRPSATDVLAWIIGPCHSKIRTSDSSRNRYPARDALPTTGQLLCAGTRMRTSTPLRAAETSDSATGGGATK